MSFKKFLIAFAITAISLALLVIVYNIFSGTGVIAGFINDAIDWVAGLFSVQNPPHVPTNI